MKTYQSQLDEYRKMEKIPDTPKSFWNSTDSQLEECFFIGQEEIKRRANILGADAVIGFKEDTDFPYGSST